jgi:uncharacterized protein YdeI (YjbR/CyaY-like superfamily)
MNDNADILEFDNREMFRTWLDNNIDKSKSIWIIFTKGNKAFTANDALEEAICFGWIDGLMKSIDNKKYKKYFSKRKDMKKWSDKNIKIYQKMIENGLMTKAGIDVFKVEKRNQKKTMDINEKIEILINVIKYNNEILSLFDQKSPSRQKQFAGFYCDAKTDETRNKRKDKIIDALKNNYNGMLW